MPEPTLTDLALFAIFVVVLVLPFTVHLIERNLEVFLFVMGALAVTVTGKWAWHLVGVAVEEPLAKGIVPAVLVAGLLFLYGRRLFEKGVNAILGAMPLWLFAFVATVILGLISSLITAIIAALLLVEIINLIPLRRADKINLVIVACFSIGLGAALTPLGEPLSTIAISKLSGPPYHAGFWYLADQIGVLILIGVLLNGLLAALLMRRATLAQGSGGRRGAGMEGQEQQGQDTLRGVIVRAGKVYAFVAALFLLGAGMEVVIEKYFTQVPAEALYWVNMLSAVLDNATLTAAEIGPALSQLQISAALMGLLVSGGMLIPGNIPNIIAAGKLGITSAEWAKLGVPLGLALNAFYFVLVFVLRFTPTLGF
ncbi:MAG: DUF1646 family protein [Chloroflexota bacterium]